MRALAWGLKGNASVSESDSIFFTSIWIKSKWRVGLRLFTTKNMEFEENPELRKHELDFHYPFVANSTKFRLYLNRCGFGRINL